ncbi:MAG: hypothetical protein DCE90_07120 [Pseudanabaena sp.]|nr:MAG: hypothetical protein DCE90_07120 [Pseudanabaena sp.]
MDKYQRLLELGTNGCNYDIETEDIIQKLQEWDAKYGLEISEVNSDSLLLTFKNLPNDLTDLALEIYEFCPDTIDQGFGCAEDMIDILQKTEQEVPSDLLEMTAGIDFADENYGLELLKRSLVATKELFLWWD